MAEPRVEKPEPGTPLFTDLDLEMGRVAPLLEARAGVERHP